jgi:hypothetical protein
MDRPSQVYRLFDFDGHLLYVGVTLYPRERLGVHRRSKPWGQHITDVVYETHPSEHAARMAEQAAIGAERPLYNVMRPTAERLVWNARTGA